MDTKAHPDRRKREETHQGVLNQPHQRGQGHLYTEGPQGLACKLENFTQSLGEVVHEHKYHNKCKRPRLPACVLLYGPLGSAGFPRTMQSAK